MVKRIAASSPASRHDFGRPSGRAPTDATIYANVMAALEQAEDPQGPRPQSYIALMVRIEDQVRRRAAEARHRQRLETKTLLTAIGDILRDCYSTLDESRHKDLTKRIREVQALIAQGVG